MTIVFTCKDPRLAEHYEKTFGEEFNKVLNEAKEAAKTMPGWGTVEYGDRTYTWREVIEQLFTMRMLEEALRQEHYNYTEVDGKREVVYVQGDSGRVPQLLIPTLEIR